MIHLNLSMAPMRLLVLTLWTIGNVKGCGDRQAKINGRCCDLCQPGTHMVDFCTETQKTVCKACPEGYFSHLYDIFDRCEKCQKCQFYDRKCTATTNATCSCAAGFLCSNSICSTCVEDKCVIGERTKQTVISSGVRVIHYSYECEPICLEHEYFDAQKNICRPLTQCSAFGFAELFPGNRTHNSVCEKPVTPRNDVDFIHVSLGISVILLSLSFVVFMSYTCINYQRMRTANHKPMLAVPTNISDFHLPKEESGLQFFQDEFKDTDTSHQLHLETIIIS